MRLEVGARVAWLHPTGQVDGVIVEIKNEEGTLTLRFDDGSERGAVPWDDVGAAVGRVREVGPRETLRPRGIESGEEIGGF